MKHTLLFLTVGLLLTSCFKEELPIDKHESGEAIEVQVGIGQDYKNQLFYSATNNTIVSTNEKTDWDLAFESSATGFHILLNTSRGMAVHRSALNFNEITDETGLDWTWDMPSGHLDSTAFGDWVANGLLYVVDFGYDVSGVHLGYKKVIVSGVSSTEYTIEFGDIADANSQALTILKNDETLFTYYKIGEGEVAIAPPNEDWDLNFTQYTHVFEGLNEPYVVTGVLLNRFNTTASRIENKPFSDVDFDDISSLTFSSNLDYIGYDWKTFDFNNSIYIVHPEVTYIIRTSQGAYYKLHFIDFYNDLGEKGFPKMEVQLL
ncbi:MAG: hypothetical protein ACJASQ_000010 [Crocinitomicaceae bacterium]|jgi:hypothetical protein